MSYWDVLAEAKELLERGELLSAEDGYGEARGLRRRSPGRVFWSETLGDAARRLWRGVRGGEAPAEDRRWKQETREFRRRFRAEARRVLDRARSDLDLPGSATATERLARCRLVVRLVDGSDLADLHDVDPHPFAAGALDAALDLPDLPAADIVPTAASLGVDARLDLAARGLHLLSRSVAAGTARRERRSALAEALLALLSPAGFERNEAEESRRWQLARLTDLYLDRPAEAAGLYIDYLDLETAGPDRREEARLRAAEILANVTGGHMPVPRYGEARRLLETTPLMLPEREARRRGALGVLDRRRPTPGEAWASVGVVDETWYVVLWQVDRPRDVFIWRTGDDPAPLREALSVCAGRIVRKGAECNVLDSRELDGYVRVFLEAESYARDDLDALAPPAFAGETSTAPPPHPALDPERVAPGSGVDRALLCGRLWRRVLGRILDADPVLRGGIRELAQRGDACAVFLGAFLPPELVAEPGWRTTHLADRANPHFAHRVPSDAPPLNLDPGLYVESSLVVSTGRPGQILGPWGQERARWRLVLDAPDRLDDLAVCLDNRGGRHTLIPPDGEVHDRRAALARLADLAGTDAAGRSSLLPLFHWTRITETHNGDLGDFLRLRPRPEGAVPLYDDYRALAADLPRMPVEADPEGWGREYVERAAESEVVAGLAEDLMRPDARLLQAWGVEPDAPAAWVFCDSPAVHWQLLRDHDVDPAVLHGTLARLGGAHLSLVLCGGFLRRDLERQLGDWLAPYGHPVCLALTDQRYPHLRLAGEGVAPDAMVEIGAAAAGLTRRLAELHAGGRRIHLLPGCDGPLTRFLSALQRGEISAEAGRDVRWESPETFWRRADGRARLRDGCLFVARLESLDAEADAASSPPSRGWESRDAALVDQDRRRRALCALEVGALLSRGAAEVEIADPRWWRSFPLGGDGEGGGQEDVLFPVPPAEAVRRVGDGWAEVNDLPQVDLPPVSAGRRWQPRRGKTDEDLEAVAAWLEVQGWIGPDRRGLPPGVLARPDTASDEDWSAGRQRLIVGEGTAAWVSVLTRVVSARERGDTEAWLLVVAESPPPAAVALRDAVVSPGVCLVGHAESAACWHAVAWAKPEDLSDARLRRGLAVAPPMEIWASDLRDWLPSARSSGLRHAPVLRALLHELRVSTTLHARNLPTSWRRYFRSLLESVTDGVYRETHSPVEGDPDLPPVTVGRVEHPRVVCPGCGEAAAWSDRRTVCPACGTGLDRWLDPAARRRLNVEIWRAKLGALAERGDLYHDRPLCLWVGPDALSDLTRALDRLGRPWRRQRDRWLTTQDADAPDWLVCVHGEMGDPPPECHHALLEPPLNEADFRDFRRQAGGAVSLWFHPLELDAGTGGLAGGPGAHARSAHRRLLTRFADPPGLDPVWRWRGWLPPRLVEILAGLPVSEVRKTQGVASWLAAVHDERSGADVDADMRDARSARLLCRDLSLVEAEYKLARLHPLIDAILPVMTASLALGEVGYVFLDDLPLEVDPVELSWLDRFLLGTSLSLSPEGVDGGDVLLYATLNGVINGPGRRLGRLGPLEGVSARLHAQVEVLAEVYRTLFAPGEDGDSPGTVALDAATAPVLDDLMLETGILLGLWHLRGPGAPGEILAEPGYHFGAEGGPLSDAAVTLLRALAGEERIWRERLVEAWHAGFVADLFGAGRRSPVEAPPVSPLAQPVVAADLASVLDQGGPELLVLRGVTGTGRFATVAQALALAVRDTLDVHDLRVYCPDVATAARFHLVWRTCARHLPAPRIRHGADLPAGTTLVGGGIPHRPDGERAVLLEAHALRPSDRFRLAQRFRLGVQIWTVEPVRSTEPWEHLFLALPDPEAMREFRDQKRQSRRVAEEVLDLADQATGRRPRVRLVRQRRGDVSARLTASLDDGITLMTEKQREWGGLLWNAVAPVPADLDYLGRAAARLGWLPVYRWELDAMLLPGPFEFLTVAGDLVAARAADESGSPEPAAPSLLSVDDGEDYALWLEAMAQAPAPTLGALLDAVTRTGWAESFLGDATARHRLRTLAADFADQDLDAFFARPLLEAWRRVVGRLPGFTPAGRGSPVLMLSTPEEAEGPAAGALAYFCLGSEAPDRHYDVISRAGDRLLVLYKDVSPLAEDGD